MNGSDSEISRVQVEYFLAHSSANMQQRRELVDANRRLIPRMVEQSLEFCEQTIYNFGADAIAMRLPDGRILTPVSLADTAEAAARDYEAATGDGRIAQEAARRCAKVHGLNIQAQISDRYKNGQYEQVVALAPKGRAFFQKAEDHGGEAMLVEHAAVSQLKLKRPAAAIELLHEVLELLQRAGLPQFRAKTFEQLAAAHMELKNTREALRCMQQALELKQQEGDALAVARLERNVSIMSGKPVASEPWDPVKFLQDYKQALNRNDTAALQALVTCGYDEQKAAYLLDLASYLAYLRPQYDATKKTFGADQHAPLQYGPNVYDPQFSVQDWINVSQSLAELFNRVHGGGKDVVGSFLNARRQQMRSNR